MLQRQTRSVPFSYNNFITGDRIEIERLKEQVLGIETKIVAELFDDLTGKKLEEWKGENILTDTAFDYMKWLMRKTIHGAVNNTGADAYFPKSGVTITPDPNDSKYAPPRWFDYISLITDSTTESATQKYSTGDIIGWADRNTYSGSDTKRGTMNIAETVLTPTTQHYVFDWATHSSNGTFRSIAWQKLNTGTNVGFPEGFTNDRFTSGAVGASMVNVDEPNDRIYLLGAGTGSSTTTTPIEVRKLSDFSLVQTNPNVTGISFNQTFNSCAMANGFFYTGNINYQTGSYTTNLNKIPVGGGAIAGQSLSALLPTGWKSGSSLGVVWDGTYFWVAVGCDTTPVANTIICQFNSTFTTLIGYTEVQPTWGTYTNMRGKAYHSGLLYDGRYFYIYASTLGTWFQLDPQNGFSYVGVKRDLPINGYVKRNNGAPLSWYEVSSNLFERTSSGMGSRILLPAPVTKTSANSLKVTYDFNIL